MLELLRRPGRPARGAVLAATACAIVLGALVGTASAAISYYKTGSFSATTVYSSVVRPDWRGNQVKNNHSASVAVRMWSYNVDSSSYIFDTGNVIITPGYNLTQGFAPQRSRNYCQRVSGGADTPGTCAGEY